MCFVVVQSTDRERNRHARTNNRVKNIKHYFTFSKFSIRVVNLYILYTRAWSAYIYCLHPAAAIPPAVPLSGLMDRKNVSVFVVRVASERARSSSWQFSKQFHSRLSLSLFRFLFYFSFTCFSNNYRVSGLGHSIEYILTNTHHDHYTNMYDVCNANVRRSVSCRSCAEGP